VIRRIILENFMSHGKTVIDLADGLTVLTGPNNCGKSAVVAALQIIASNGNTTHVMRHGSKLCRVTVETDEQQTIVWERKKTTVKYQINGEDVHRIGQGIPPRLHDVLKLDRVTTTVGATKDEYDIHFGQQKSPVFLLDQPASRAAAFFASSSDASRLIEMQGRHRNRVQKSRSEAKRLESELRNTTTRLAGYAPIDAISQNVEVAEEVAARIDRDRRRCERLHAGLHAAAVAVKTRDDGLSVCKTLESLQPPAPQHPTASFQSLIERLRHTHQDQRRASATLACCQPLTTVPAMLPAEACRRSLQRLRDSLALRHRLRRTTQSLGPLTVVPSIHDTARVRVMMRRLSQAVQAARAASVLSDSLVELERPPRQTATQTLHQQIRALRTARLRWDQAKRSTRSLESLRAADPPSDTTPLRQVFDQLRQARKRVNDAEVSARQAADDVQRHQRRIHDFVRQHPKCQTCGGSIDPETLMSAVPEFHVHSDHESKVSVEKSS